MKILYINIGMHEKNHNALMNYKNISFYVINNMNLINNINLKDFDCVYSPGIPIDVSLYPDTKFMFGPHFSVFPELHKMNVINKSNSIYIQPSKWAAEVWENHPYCKNIKIKSLPFGVETNKFNEIKNDAQSILIDLREQNEIDKDGMIKNSTVVRFPEINEYLQQNKNTLKDKRILFYCAHGHRSTLAVQLSKSYQFTNCFHLIGGLKNWKKEGLDL